MAAGVKRTRLMGRYTTGWTKIGVVASLLCGSVVIFATIINYHHAYFKGAATFLASQMARDAQVIFQGYQDQLKVFSRVFYASDLDASEKTNMLKGLFDDFPDFVGVTFYQDGQGEVSIYDASQLDVAGLRRIPLSNELPVADIKNGSIYVANSTWNEALPTLTLAIKSFIPESRKAVVVAGLVRLDKLLSIAHSSALFESIITDSLGVALIHSDALAVKNHEMVDWLVDVTEPVDVRNGDVAPEYLNQEKDYVVGVSAVGFAGLLAGVKMSVKPGLLVGRASAWFVELWGVFVLLGLSLLCLILAPFRRSENTNKKPVSTNPGALEKLQTRGVVGAEKKLLVGGIKQFIQQDSQPLEWVDMNQLVEHATASIALQPHAKKMEIVNRLAPGLPPVKAHAWQIRYVLTHVITYAQQVSGNRPGGRVGVMTAQRRGKWLEIIVKCVHSASGEAAEFPMSGGCDANCAQDAGADLGVSIGYGIIQAHQGSMRIIDEAGGGVTAVIILPVAAEQGGECGSKVVNFS